MCKFILIFLGISFCVNAQKATSVYIDDKGVMRWSDSQKEASFFGVNYTLPFAHAYRAAGYIGVDRKEVIDEDVYHFARLGFNAYRIHIWDVEISDAEGNLIENEHLDLLDYLIAKLSERNIYTLITAQTNFGNGYPERNINTEAYAYNYDKCQVHNTPQAIKAQQRYLSALVRHVNPYTEKAYKDDDYVVGFEINNEPCHRGTKKQVRSYINKMLAALKKAGCKKPIFYNVSHNMDIVEAYYDTDIQGTTYQWYPTGLVAGYTRKGNFLPAIDNYHIPFSGVKGFEHKTKLAYEFDPADILFSYAYPAMVRTFRSAGFQWITQFAYDPMFMAWANTEYQTHFLNLAYTPGKAISMKIAAAAAQALPMYKSYGIYPEDTLFADFRVSHKANLSEWNSDTSFYYSNNTKTLPKNALHLRSIAGVGNSPTIHYEGTGAYFIDKLEDGVWRLELMPDAVCLEDPFAKTSLEKEVVRLYRREWDMLINLPNLGENFSIRGINEGHFFEGKASKCTIKNITPGVYILEKEGIVHRKNYSTNTRWKNIALGEYAAPKSSNKEFTIYHKAAKVVESNTAFEIKAMVAGNHFPDSVLVYTDEVSFWKKHNPYYKMERTQGYSYKIEIPAKDVKGENFAYCIVVFKDGKKQTLPANVDKGPLDWDYTSNDFYRTHLLAPLQAIELFNAESERHSLETYTMDGSNNITQTIVQHSPVEKPTLNIRFQAKERSTTFFVRKFIADDIAYLKKRLISAKNLCIQLKKAPSDLKIGFITTDSYTYLADCSSTENDIVKIPINSLQQSNTALLPHAYPVFLNKYFVPESDILFRLDAIESLELRAAGEADGICELEIGSIWIE